MRGRQQPFERLGWVSGLRVRSPQIVRIQTLTFDVIPFFLAKSTKATEPKSGLQATF